MENEYKPIKQAILSDKDFSVLSDFIYKECGIKITPPKKTMIESRLQKRIRKLSLGSFREYLEYLFSPAGTENELVHMIDVVTTNKTDFFREPAHFDFLVKKALPELGAMSGAGIRRPLGVWSAGCSTGEEPYTLAMVLSAYAAAHPGFRFFILATDISTQVLEKARLGIYEEEKIAPVPANFKKEYLLRSKDKNSRLVRMTPELRSLISFRRLNFMEGDFGFREKMDIIFCRNVIIYFDKKTQERLIGKFCNHLNHGGYVLLGHSETLFGMDLPLVQAAPTVYKRL